MAVLWVHEGYQKEFGRKISDYTSELSEIKSQYSKAFSQVSSYSGDSHVASCNTFLKKRQKDLQSSISRANSLKTSADAYVSSVVSADKRVAASIHKQSYSFYKSKGIGPQSDSMLGRAWNTISTAVSDFWHDACGFAEKVVEGIKNFYEEYKYLFNVLFDVLAIAAAVALFAATGGTLFGIICNLGAYWATAKATYELVTDMEAAAAWWQGDIALAEELSNRTLAGDLVKAGKWLDGKLGNFGIFEGITQLFVVGGDAFQFVATVALVWDQFRDIFNLKLNAKGKPLKILDPRAKMTPQARKFGWTMFKAGGTKGMGARFASGTNWLKFGAWGLGFSFKKNAKTMPEFLFSLLEKGDKNVKKIKTIITDPSSILKNLPGVPETMKFWDKTKEILAM